MICDLSNMVKSPKVFFFSLSIYSFLESAYRYALPAFRYSPVYHGKPKLPSASASSVLAIRSFLTSSLVDYKVFQINVKGGSYITLMLTFLSISLVPSSPNIFCNIGIRLSGV